jgi:hypothetical protein
LHLGLSSLFAYSAADHTSPAPARDLDQIGRSDLIYDRRLVVEAPTVFYDVQGSSGCK